MAFLIFSLLIINFSLLIGAPNSQDIKMEISPTTSNIFKVEDSLNLTCKVESDLDGDILLEWRLPMNPLNSQHKIDVLPGTKNLNLVVRNLKEADSGDYKCLASSNTNPDLMWEKVVRVSVKPTKKCQDSWFPCVIPKCLHKRYTCDGTPDCKGGEDEHPSLCGRNPCKNKIMCADGRCIPQQWCCDNTKDANCTTRHLPQCCAPLREFPDNRGYNTHETQRYNDVAFFQTTVYTVIGCAMAFMFIVTILVIAICRVHMRRSLLPRYASAARRNPSVMRTNAPPLYELDVLFNQRDFMSVNPLLVTYNINNGVQFVGRPVAPPPYCEVVAAPPREGPPPPYASDENLALVRTSSKVDIADDSQDGEEPKESDSLLPAPSISVISSNTIDSTPVPSSTSDTTPVRSTYTVNLTEDAAGGSPTLTVVETQVRNARTTPHAEEGSTAAS